MPKAPSEVKDNINILLEMDRHGWSRFHLIDVNKRHCFWVSDVYSNFSEDMLSLCEHVLKNKTIRVALCDEPGGAIVSLVPNPEQHHLVELSIEEVDANIAGFGSEQIGKPVFGEIMKRKQVLTMVMTELWKAHYLLQDKSYQKDRDPFPHEQLMRLNQTWNDSDLGPSCFR